MGRWLVAILLGVLLGLGMPLVSGGGEPAGSALAAWADSGESLGELRAKAFELTRAGQFDLAERYWSKLIERLPEEPALWSNRGNVRISQNKVADAIADYTEAIRLDPLQPDAYLNRGAAWEAQGDWDAAVKDYNRVIKLSPDDPAAYNNRANARGGQGDWAAALADYEQAITIDPAFSLAYANYGMALFQVGDTAKSVQILRSLVRKYPNFADVRAALTAVLWETGQRGEAESQWVAVRGLDRRYTDLAWVVQVRRWPPALVQALDHFLHL